MPDDDAQWALIGAIRAALDERQLSQRALGALVAHLEQADAYPQSTVGGWLSGKTYLRPTRVFAIEDALGMRRGTLSTIEGYTRLDEAPVVTVEEALAADPDISVEQAEMLGAAVSAARTLTRSRPRRARRSS
jgi:hypothetical protein